MSMSWMERAACKDLDPNMSVFFAASHSPRAEKEAKKLCAGCEVRDDCLEFALRTPVVYGIWGGMNEHERDRLRRHLRLQGSA